MRVKAIILFTLISFYSCSIQKKMLVKRDEGIEFIKKSDFQFDYVYLYAYLQRHYPLSNIHQIGEVDQYKSDISKIDSNSSSKILRRMELYRRLLDPQYTINSNMINSSSGLDSLMLMALYCDRQMIDTTSYFNELRLNANAGQYQTTHSLLSTIFLEENNCFGIAELKSVKTYVQQKNIELISEPKTPLDDIKIESIALLLHSGKAVDYDIIKNVLKSQNNDGGWSITQNEPASNPHTTLLAIWILTAIINKQQLILYN